MVEYGDTSHQSTTVESTFSKEAPLTFKESGISLAFAINKADTYFASTISHVGYLDIVVESYEWGLDSDDQFTETITDALIHKCTADD